MFHVLNFTGVETQRKLRHSIELLFEFIQLKVKLNSLHRVTAHLEGEKNYTLIKKWIFLLQKKGTYTTEKKISFKTLLQGR